MLLRTERPGDKAAIHALTTAAFRAMPYSSGTEAAIVDRLRRACALTLSLVAERDGMIVGHVAFSPVSIDAWSGLGPVSVRPDLQRQGIGSALIRAGLGRLRADGTGGCVVLGDPRYYARFGFAADPSLWYGEGPGPYFQYLCFHGPLPAGEVRFHDAFDEA